MLFARLAKAMSPCRPTRAADTLVVGAGFAGIEVARALGRAGMGVTIIDRQNHHLFQPLLYQVATAALSPADIAEPVRKMLRRYPTVEVLLGTVTEIDVQKREVVLASGVKFRFRVLVVASGAEPSYFGHHEWAACAPSLKTIEDAREIRTRVLLAFEFAEMCDDPDRRRDLMTLAVIGGGPTGVELAGSIAELARYALARDFHNIRPQTTRVLLIEAGPRILSGFPQTLSNYAEGKLRRLGVTVCTNTPVQAIEPDAVVIGRTRLAVGLAIWAAGVRASPLGKSLGVATDSSGRVEVTEQLNVPGRADVFVLGDLARFLDSSGNLLPGLAQVAKQQGIYVGRLLVNRSRGVEAGGQFMFQNRGNTAIIGRHAAVFDFGWTQARGWFAWALWALIHVYLLVGFEHRFVVAVQWLWRYLTYERGARLIAQNAATRISTS